MFRAAYRSLSGALTVFAASGLHRHVATGRSQVRVGTLPTQTWLRPVRRADNLTTFRCRCLEIWEPQPPGTLRACPGL